MNGERIGKLTEALRGFLRNEIRIECGAPVSDLPVGTSKFGGLPDCPEDFVWPEYEGEELEAEKEEEEYTVSFRRKGHIRAPHAFLGQIDCREASRFDSEGLLPRDGLLSFFYELNTMRWGFDPADRGCACVYWFPPETKLRPTPVPKDAVLPDFMGGKPIPGMPLSFSAHSSCMSYDDFCETEEEREILKLFPGARFWEDFDAAVKRIGWDEDDWGDRHKLLGWPDVIQEAMQFDCEAVTSGIYMGDGSGMDRLTRDEKIAMGKKARAEWILLFQMGTIRVDGFELMWGDCGHLYFWIRREDLKNRDFSRIWLMMQCG